MSSTRRQKAKAMESRVLDMMSDFGNLYIMIGNENINPIGRDSAKTIGESTVQYDVDSNPHPREISSQENEFRNVSYGNIIPRHVGALESIETFTDELNL